MARQAESYLIPRRARIRCRCRHQELLARMRDLELTSNTYQPNDFVAPTLIRWIGRAHKLARFSRKLVLRPNRRLVLTSHIHAVFYSAFGAGPT